VQFSTQKVVMLLEVYEKIRFLRESNNWSQEEMAEKLNMSPSGYSKIERGETKPALAKLVKIAEIFEVDLIELIPLDGKNIYLIGTNNGNNVNGCHVFNSPSELAFENQKLQMQLELKDKELAMKDRENDNLREIIALLKRELPQSQPI
jgi:transcriptional regulator with XRE-family HTH domain